MITPLPKIAVISMLFVLLAQALGGPAYGQDRLDSLDAVYRDMARPDSIRYKAAQELSFSLIFSDGPRAKSLILKAMGQAQKEAPDSKSYWELYQNLGIYYDVNQQTDSSFTIFSEILEKSREKGWRAMEQRSNNNLGMSSLNSSDYRNAIEYFSEALSLARKNPAAKETDWVNYLSNLGLANQELLLYDQAIKYHLEALAIRERSADSNGIAISCANLGICYNLMQEESQAIAYFQKAIHHAQLAGNKVLYHRVHDNLGSLYIGMNEYAKGLEMLKIALDTSDGFVMDPKMELSIVSNSAAALVAIGRVDEALGFANRGEKILQDYPHLVNYSLTLTNSLAKIHFRKGDFDKGNAYLEKYQDVSKLVFNEENAELLTDLQVKYDLEKKESQIALQNAELQEKNAILQRNYFAFAALGLLFLLGLGTFVYYQNRAKRKQELLVKDRELKVKEAYIQASLESQEQERRRMAQDLHDGFGQYISALRMYVTQLKSGKAKEELKSELVSRTDSVLDEMSREISNVVYDLMPATLIRFGLKSALEDLAHRINAGQKVHLELDFGKTLGRMDELVEINLFRICQEWVNNVLKYSGATHILLSLSEESGRVTLGIKDDGLGFDQSVFVHSKRNGWKNINTRAGLLSAELSLHTEKGRRGTELFVRFPYVYRVN
ncbi:tetratricopeptide repeat protein [Algoriphagus sp. H41]|uniref:histidine kinase n=1 Tax=Algoriphagus oliviformis TaxID=2811231 RepID=A0ABS3C1E9_9BACT|nr:tetratricopeptide repeat protein [Algoriphagus oliviformis]MBN7809986.1 tetratricopeptide repeat protein [Algoriphagus oliviformis]